ncbi:ABC transporter ATP-binding protein [Demequina sp. NBRC 110057]|uniref:ATP-binding cassette domain-containing protein n=1 Tax=Demequina sp. NBRC 110057 TaxID=1570346 RepID=UPI0009FC8673|nr:ABC transporter ATP-binding protein [Demequina sp. NBRC 110057]
MTTASPVLTIDDLTVQYRARGRTVTAVSDVTLTLAAGECLGLVGESGSGKSTIGAVVQGILPADGSVTATGAVAIDGRPLVPVTDPAWREIRGRAVTTVFQDPMRSLDPTMRIGRMLDRYTGSADASAEALERVQIRDPRLVLRKYPHQLSGGMRQRIMIALALSRKPSILVADEPTTALDVSVQAEVLTVLKEAASDAGCGVIFVTHDLGVAHHMCDRLAVLQRGRVVEQGPVDEVIGAPTHEYTRRLMASRLTLDLDRSRPVGPVDDAVVAAMADAGAESTVPADLTRRWDAGELTWDAFVGETAALGAATGTPPAHLVSHVTRTSLSLNGISKSYRGHGRGKRGLHQVLHDVSLEVGYREAVALVGESGSGKSTTLKIAAGIEKPDAGTVSRQGVAGEGTQVVFQDAGASLTPWLTVEQILLERIEHTRTGAVLSKEARLALAAKTIGLVGLPPEVLAARPTQLSGGQQQRVAIARAVAVPPSVLLCDEPTSALDVSVACSVLNLISLLRHSLGISVLFVTHDLAAARLIADRVAVMTAGRIVETVPGERLAHDLTTEYGRRLVDASLA